MTSQTTLGTTIGRHRIARLLGGGAVGRVFACKSPEREQLVAIKLLRSKYVSIGEALLKHRQVLERIDSPHAVKIHDVAVFNNNVYVVMDLVEGESLAERLTKGMMRTVDALALARGIVLGLQAGWAHGVAHGDVRPANVLLQNGHVQAAKVVDFQLAAPVEGTESVRGSPSYLAPELLVGTPCDALTDLYAVGCLLHEVLTGKPPFTGSAASVLHAQANTTPPTLAATVPGAPQGLVDLVDRLLEKDRAKRVKTHGEALAGIERALAGQGMAPARGPDIPAYDVDGDGDPESFDHERTDEFHVSPARETLEHMLTPPARPAFTEGAPADVSLDNAPTQVRSQRAAAPASVPSLPTFAPLPPLPPLAPSAALVPVVPVRGPRDDARAATPTFNDGIDVEEERTRIEANIAAPIPSAEDLGLVLTPVDDD